jgi:hypothetical protein
MAVGAGITRRHVVFGGIILFILWLWIAHDRESAFPTQIIWNTRPGGHLADPELDVFDFPPVDNGTKPWSLRVITTMAVLGKFGTRY